MGTLAASIASTIAGGVTHPLKAHLPLTHTLQPLRGNASYTFDRASVATVKDHAGKIHECDPNEARFEGARRVKNYCDSSEDVTGGSWIPASGFVAGKDYAIGDSLGDVLNYDFVATSTTITFSVDLKLAADSANPGRSQILLYDLTNATSLAQSPLITLSTNGEYVRHSYTVTNAIVGTNLRAYFYIGRNTDVYPIKMNITRVQIEQGVTTPSDYVSTGVGTGPEIIPSTGFTEWTDPTVPDEWIKTGTINATNYVEEGVSGGLRLVSDGAFTGIEKANAFVTGKTYIIEYEYSDKSASLLNVKVGASQYGMTEVVGVRGSIIVVANGPHAVIQRNSITCDCTLSYFSIKEIDHGANVDGVKYFPTTNGNTVDGNSVVTEGNGAELSTTTTFRKGFKNLLSIGSATVGYGVADKSINWGWSLSTPYGYWGTPTQLTGGTVLLSESGREMTFSGPVGARCIAATTTDLEAGKHYVCTVEVVSASGGGGINDFRQYISDTPSAGSNSVVIPADAAPGVYAYRFTASADITGALHRFGIGTASPSTNTGTIVLKNPSFQEVDNLTDDFYLFNDYDYVDSSMPVGNIEGGADSGLVIPAGNKMTRDHHWADSIFITGDSFTNDTLDFPQILQREYAGTVNCFAYSGYGYSTLIGSNFETNLATYDYPVVILQGGVNDINGGLTAAQLQDYWLPKVEHALAQGKRVFALNISPWGNFTGQSASEATETTNWNNWLADYCSRSPVTLIDIYTPLEGAAGTLDAAYDSGDGLHLNLAGNQVIVQLIKDALAQPTALKGYLAEPQRTNQLLYTTDITNWLAQSNIVTFSAPDSDGFQSIIPDGITGFHYACYNSSITLGLEYWMSFDAKPDGYDWLQVAISTGFNAILFVTFNVATGAVGSKHVNSAEYDYSITPNGDGSYHIKVGSTATTTDAAGRFVIAAYATDPGQRVPSTTPDGVSGVKVRGINFEVGDHATSWIPTDAGSVTRATDQLTYPDLVIPDAAGSMCVTTETSTDGSVYTGGMPILSVNDSITSLLYFNASTDVPASYDGTNVARDNAATYIDNTPKNTAVSWGGNGLRIISDGVAATSAAYSGSFSPTTLQVGHSTGYAFSGYISEIKIYNKQLTDLKLQDLTSV